MDSMETSELIHAARAVLHRENTTRITMPVCDHYAGNAKFLHKALQLQQTSSHRFDITIDLEDGAQTGQELELALWAHQALIDCAQNQLNTPNRLPGVRIHPINHPAFQSDLQTLLDTHQNAVPSYLMLPKPNDLQEVVNAWQTIETLSKTHGVKPPALHVLIETHGALADVHAIAALPYIECLAFGIMDFISAHHGILPMTLADSPLQFEHPVLHRAKLEIAAACHRYGKVASHSVCRAISHPEQAFKDALQAHHQYGFTRMWSIHPTQIEGICKAMKPSAQALSEAKHILESAFAANWGPISVANTLHDRASFRYYLDVLEAGQS